MKRILGTAALLVMSMAAGAQGFDIDIAMTVGNTAPWLFTGSFDFDGAKSCTLASVLCAPGSAQFSNVNVSDGFNGGTFTAGSSADGKSVVLYDLNGLPTLSSSVLELSFTVNPSLGPQPHYSLSNILLAANANSTGTFACGQSDPTRAPVTCSASLKGASTPVTQAPEVDPQSSVAALSFFFSALLVMRSRRPRGPK